MVLRTFSLLALLACCSAHSFLTVPMPISTVETCRIGGNPGFESNCGGPCPNFNFREDMRPENPAETWERGQEVTIHYSKNNHHGGFMRLSMVPLDEMNRKDVHDIMAFFFSCWSGDGYSCNDKEYHRDCGFDLENLAWKATFTVPSIYPDGVYVFGWTWYGGGESTGDFGDYHDCSYVRIRGGPMVDSHQAIFKPGPRYSDGCQAAVDRLGICPTEPCPAEFRSSKMIPGEFQGPPPTIYRDWYEQALSRPQNQVSVAEPTHFGITSFSLYDVGSEMKIDVDLNEYVDISGRQGINIVPEYYGDIQSVEWIVNGKSESHRHDWPFAIGGQQPNGNGGFNYFDWPYPVLDKRVFVTAIAHSHGQRQYYSQDFYFYRNF